MILARKLIRTKIRIRSCSQLVSCCCWTTKCQLGICLHRESNFDAFPIRRRRPKACFDHGEMADQRLLRRLMWWRKWSKRDWAIAASAASAAVFAISIVSISLISYSLTKPSHHPTTQPTPWVPLTLLNNAHHRGACNFL